MAITSSYIELGPGHPGRLERFGVDDLGHASVSVEIDGVRLPIDQLPRQRTALLRRPGF